MIIIVVHPHFDRVVALSSARSKPNVSEVRIYSQQMNMIYSYNRGHQMVRATHAVHPHNGTTEYIF
jgi:hypothetical protein